MAETVLDGGKSIFPDAGPDTKLACAAGTVSWTQKDLRRSGTFCVKASTAKDAEPVKEGPAITFHKNGARHEEGFYANGKRTGHWMTFNDRGNKESEGDWTDGERDGLYISFWPTGKRSAEAHYKAGKMNGETKTWDDRGKLMAISVFADDTMVSQKEFADY
jgi:antitoxin component YwqK of YwqJK toxin-antitoxin module